MGEIINQLINGILVGSIYGLVAVGLTLLYGILRVANFAQGEYFMLGAFFAWALTSILQIPYELAIVGTIGLSLILALLVSLSVMERLVDPSFEVGVLATMGVSMIFQNGAQLLFGHGFKFFSGGWNVPVELFGITLSAQRLAILAITIGVFVALQLFVSYTRAGRIMRAVSQNYEGALVVGIDVKRVVRYTVGVGVALAGLAGALMAPIVVSLYPQMGFAFTLKAFVVIALGGLGNMMGAFIGALLLGVAESFVAGYVGMSYRDAFAFVVLIAVLLFRPHGLFGRSVRA